MPTAQISPPGLTGAKPTIGAMVHYTIEHGQNAGTYAAIVVAIRDLDRRLVSLHVLHPKGVEAIEEVQYFESARENISRGSEDQSPHSKWSWPPPVLP